MPDWGPSPSAFRPPRPITPGNTTTTGVVAVGGHVSGNLSTVGQSDWFKITLNAGTQYVFDLAAGTLGAPAVSLYDAAGNLVVAGDAGSTTGDSITSFTPTTSGTYYISASGAQSTTGTFSLSVTTRRRRLCRQHHHDRRHRPSPDRCRGDQPISSSCLDIRCHRQRWQRRYRVQPSMVWRRWRRRN